MAALTFTIEPDEFLGLSALVELGQAADGGNTGAGPSHRRRHRNPGGDADAQRASGQAAGSRPVRGLRPRRQSSSASPRPRRRLRGTRALIANKKLRKYLAYAVAVAFSVALWGGYSRGWKWTGFQKNDQLWDWLNLLLLPVVIGTLPLWIQDRKYIGRGRRMAYAVAIVAWTGFVIAGYPIPLNWTGFRDQTLWNWFELLVLPAALAITMALTSMGLRMSKVLHSLRRYQQAIMAGLAVGWVLTVIGGYLLRWTWTGYSGNTLWDWLQLLLLPLVFPAFLLPALLNWVSGDAAGRASEARQAIITPIPATAGRKS